MHKLDIQQTRKGLKSRHTTTILTVSSSSIFFVNIKNIALEEKNKFIL